MEVREQSEFNDALGYINRLNALFYAADDASISRDIISWLDCLMAISRELSPVMNGDEINYAFDNSNKLNKLITENPVELTISGGFRVDGYLYMELHMFDIWLRKIQKSAGLLMKTADDPSKALM